MDNLEELVNYAKNYGFVFQGSEIYGGLANTWDYGPLGVELKNNLKKYWWEEFVSKSIYNVGLDSSILMNSRVWKASGHLDGFSDPLIDCKSCNTRYRADQLVEEQTSVSGDGLDNDELMVIIKENKLTCNKCGASNFTNIRNFNLMFETQQGVVEGSTNSIYLRPETAQGIFTNFRNIQRSMRLKLPFGVGQIGKSFRNEITPGNFTFRTREFEQMELEFFCKPGEEHQWFDYWSKKAQQFLKDVGVDENKIHLREHSSEELSHYSNATTDIEFDFPFGQKELWGIASRTDYDLKAHMNESKENLEYFDEVSNTRYIPYVIEPSLGVERLFLAVLTSCYTIDDERLIMKFPTKIAPYKAAVFPLVKKYHLETAEKIYQQFIEAFPTAFDMSGSIGKRYARQDAIGTPYCITVDDNSVDEGLVTLRTRDTKEQFTMTIDEAITFIKKEL